VREDHPDAVKVVVRMSDGSNSQESADIQTGEPIHRFSFPYVSAAHMCPYVLVVTNMGPSAAAQQAPHLITV
jgi:hypothetical protein